MKRTTTIVLFASIFAVAVGTLGLSGNSTTLMAAAIPAIHQQPVDMLGHVEYTLVDDAGNIKAYMQGDNDVVNTGKDCVSEAVFGVGTCAFGGASNPAFTYVAIGNGTTATVGVLNQTLSDGPGSENNNSAGCATTGGDGGEMARKLAATISAVDATASTGTVVTIDTSNNPFSFNADNATVVRDSGLFNADYNGGPLANNVCTGTQTAGTHFEMFSRQLLNAANGITVSDGDSLSVKWTITVG